MVINPSQIRNWTIYKIVNPNGRHYIGITLNVHKRRYNYKKCDCKHQVALFKSLKKYGFEKHSFDIIDTFSSSYEYAFGKEMFWIRSYMANAGRFPEQGGLNMTDGGLGSAGIRRSEETRKKLRDANLGKKYSEDTKMKLSAIKKGKKIKSGWTEEKRIKMRETKLLLNYRHTDEAKKKISEAGIGNKYNVGKKLSQAHIDAIRISNMGNKYRLGSKETPQETEVRISKIRGLKRTTIQLEQMKERAVKIFGKPILQYDLSMNFIKEHRSTSEAAECLGVARESIKDALRVRKNNRFKNFIFKYK